MTKHLTATEEKRLIEAANCGDVNARNRVIMNIYFLVRRFVRKRLVQNDSEREDAIQFVVIMLCEKFHKFDTNRNNRFITYAHYWVRVALQVFRLKRGLIHLPRPSQNRNQTIQGDGQLMNTRLSIPSIEPADLNQNHYYQDYLCTQEPSPEYHLEVSDDVAEMNNLLDQLLPRERDVVLRRSRGEKLQEIGIGLGLTRERIRQIERDAIHQMKKWHLIQNNIVQRRWATYLKHLNETYSDS